MANHSMVFYAGQVYCTKCSARLDGFPDFGTANDCPFDDEIGVEQEPKENSFDKVITESVKESYFDRMDKKFKNK